MVLYKENKYSQKLLEMHSLVVYQRLFPTVILSLKVVQEVYLLEKQQRQRHLITRILKGMEACASIRLVPFLHSVYVFFPQDHFVDFCGGQGCLNSIPFSLRKFVKLLNSPPQSVCKVFIFLSNLFSTRFSLKYM